MVDVGHVLIGMSGRMLRPDVGFCSLVGSDRDDLVGRSLLDVTAPIDRPRCADCMTRLRMTGRSFQVAKRLLRKDGSTLWVTKTVAMADFAEIQPGDEEAPAILATVVPLAPSYRDDPGALLQIARHSRDARNDRKSLFGTTLMAEPAWDLILAAYIVEAEGNALDHSLAAAMVDLSLGVTRRWLAALCDAAVLEKSPDGRYGLTRAAHRDVEVYLSQRLLRIAADHDQN